MNTASRMESTGQRNKIQISPDTADILIKNGRSDWLVKRHEQVLVKGKGMMTTYWLLLKTSSQSHGSSVSNPSTVPGESKTKKKSGTTQKKKKKEFWSGTDLDGVLGQTDVDDDIQRLVSWNVDVLLILLKRVVTARMVAGAVNKKLSADEEKRFSSNALVLDDFQLVIDMPKFDADVASRMYQEDVELVPEVKKELYDYVAAIASGYKRNAFHNFEHASHVILSANKLLKRIMAADDCKPLDNALTCKELHNHTYGIGTDPLTQFAVVFSALIRKCSHREKILALLMPSSCSNSPFSFIQLPPTQMMSGTRESQILCLGRNTPCLRKSTAKRVSRNSVRSTSPGTSCFCHNSRISGPVFTRPRTTTLASAI